VLAACERAFAEARVTSSVLELGAAFSAAPSISIDNAVMEKTANAAVVPLVAGWSDVGSWSALHDAVTHDPQGNSVQGDVLLESCRNTFVAARHRVVAAIGLEDVVVVETDDAVLVVHRDRAQDVKLIVERLQRRNAAK
jgi:mannose-1-phosphate guanylyltransferase